MKVIIIFFSKVRLWKMFKGKYKCLNCMFEIATTELLMCGVNRKIVWKDKERKI